MQCWKTITPEELDDTLNQHELWLRRRFEGAKADFTDTDLRPFDLSRQDLRYAVFKGANLEGVCVMNSNLQGADFSKANLKFSDFSCSDLSDADLTEANLEGASLISTKTHMATFHKALFKDTNTDFSSLPLWCGSLSAQVDDKIISQILYHLLSLIQKGESINPHIKELLLTPDIIDIANTFHRVEECGFIDDGLLRNLN